MPGLYDAVPLMAKNQRGKIVSYHLSNVTWTDGSLQQVSKMVGDMCGVYVFEGDGRRSLHTRQRS